MSDLDGMLKYINSLVRERAPHINAETYE